MDTTSDVTGQTTVPTHLWDGSRLDPTDCPSWAKYEGPRSAAASYAAFMISGAYAVNPKGPFGGRTIDVTEVTYDVQDNSYGIVWDPVDADLRLVTIDANLAVTSIDADADPALTSGSHSALIPAPPQIIINDAFTATDEAQRLRPGSSNRSTVLTLRKRNTRLNKPFNNIVATSRDFFQTHS